MHYLIGIGGRRDTGKTYYLIRLVEYLVEKNSLAAYKLKFDFFDNESRLKFRELRQKALSGQLDGTIGDIFESITLKIKHHVNGGNYHQYAISFFNTSGENYEKFSPDRVDTSHVHAIIYLMDPGHDVGLNGLLVEQNQTTDEASSYRTEEIIDEIYRQYCHTSMRKADMPLAVCISKFDLLEHHQPDKIDPLPYVDEKGAFIEKSTSPDLQLRDLKKRSNDLNTFLKNHSFAAKPALFESKFGDVWYFGLAPIGFAKKAVAYQFHTPKGILGPFLWILDVHSFFGRYNK